MHISGPDPTTSVVLLSGPVEASDAARLRTALVTAMDAVPGDLLVDGRDVTSFDDACLSAFTAARSRAKWHRSSIVVLGADDDPLTAALRRGGHLPRIPAYPDAETALAALAQRRATRAGMALVAGGADGDSAETDRDGRANPYRRVVE